MDQNDAIQKAIQRKEREKETLSKKVNELTIEINTLNTNLYTMKNKETKLNEINKSLYDKSMIEYMFTKLDTARDNLKSIYNKIIEKTIQGGADDEDENLPRYWAKKSLSKKVKKKERLRKIMFEDFLECVKGQIPSWLEDDHNIFDIKPFVEDISYSDMIVRLKAEGLHL